MPKLKDATKEEVERYAELHREEIIETVRGVVAVEVGEDGDGTYMRLKIQDQDDDTRTVSPDLAVMTFYWSGRGSHYYGSYKG